MVPRIIHSGQWSKNNRPCLATTPTLYLYNEPTVNIAKRNWALGLFFVVLVTWLFARSILTDSAGNIIAGDRMVWTDWPLHFSIAASFAWGNNFPPENPTFAGIPLVYPFVSDLISGLLLKLGTSFWTAFALPGMVFTLLFVLLYLVFTYHCLSSSSIFRKTTRNTRLTLSFCALLISLFWGGLGGFIWLYETAVQIFSGNLQSFYPTREYTFLQEHGFWFLNFLYGEILPQRAFLLGLPLFFTVLLAALKGWRSNKWYLFALAGIITGVMPFFHTHSFISLIIFMVTATVLTLVYQVTKRQSIVPLLKSIFIFCVSAALLVLPQLPLLLSQSTGFPFHFGWTKGSENFFLFWFKNTSIFWPLFILGITKGGFSFPVKLFGVASVSLFILPNLFQFAPWMYDNLKILTYWYLIGAVFVSTAIYWIGSNLPKTGVLFAILLVFLLTFSGVVEVSRLLVPERTRIRLWTRQDQELALRIRQKTDPNAVFLTAPVHDHPVSALAGRKIVLGFPGNSWSWGIKGWDTRERDVHRMYKGGAESLMLLKQYKVRFVAIGDQERSAFPVINEPYFRAEFPILLRNGSTTVYLVQ